MALSDFLNRMWEKGDINKQRKASEAERKIRVVAQKAKLAAEREKKREEEAAQQRQRNADASQRMMEKTRAQVVAQAEKKERKEPSRVDWALRVSYPAPLTRADKPFAGARQVTITEVDFVERCVQLNQASLTWLKSKCPRRIKVRVVLQYGGVWMSMIPVEDLDAVFAEYTGAAMVA